MKRTLQEINEKIHQGKVKAATAKEAKLIIQDKGIKYFLNNFDVVTCASFEINTNALFYISFGQTDPLIYFSEAEINGITAFPTGPTDLALSCVAYSINNPTYGGGHIIEDLLNGKDIHLRAKGKHLEVFINKEFETWFNLNDLNSAKLLLNQGINQNSIVATNSGNKDINSHFGTLIAHIENSTFNSSSYLNPLINDPFCKTIGVGTKVWVAGSEGLVIGEGSFHNPLQKRNQYGIPVGNAITLSVIADVRSMQPKWIRGGYIKSFGPVLFVGIGVPIPILNEEIAEYVSVTDDMIHTTIVDFSIPRRTKPTFGQCTYAELRTSTVIINKKPTLSAPLSSMSFAGEICEILKKQIENKKFVLSEPVSKIDLNSKHKKLDSKVGELV